MLYGGDDMGQREEIFIPNEPPFYEHVTRNLKTRVLEWVESTVRAIKPEERMVMVISGGYGGGIFFDSSEGQEIIEVEELYSVLELLPDRVSVLFISLACFAGSWGRLASLETNRQIMVEASSSAREKSKNHLSASLRCHCSFFLGMR